MLQSGLDERRGRTVATLAAIVTIGFVLLTVWRLAPLTVVVAMTAGTAVLHGFM